MQKISALIADDHQLFREGLETLLRKIPTIGEIYHAADGDQVLVRMEKNPCDIIFMDIRMPNLNGIETTKHLTRMRSKAKVIALTMMEDNHSVVSMFRAGAHGYLLKNTSFEELKEAIVCTLNNGRYFSKDISQGLMSQYIENKAPSRPVIKSTELTEREREIVELICRGFSSKEVAEILEIAHKTVETHRANIYSKLNISNLADLAFYALDNGIVIRKV